MKVVRIDFREIPTLEASAACIGYFDGMHKGHQKLLNLCLKTAKKKHLKSAVCTFDPDPWTVFYPEKKVHHLFTLEDKIHFAQKQGFDAFYISTFTKEFASNDVTSFHEIVKKMHIEHLICGFDFQYACRNQGNVHTLQQQSDFAVSVVESVNEKQIKISSSRIEPLVCQGQVLKANRLLGVVYSIEGTIVKGFQRGSKILGIPTANLNANSEYIQPMVGVYAGMVSVEDRLYGAMINIGNNPTFENKFQTIEANIFHFNEDIYGKTVRVFFFDKIRDEKKFSGAKELKEQLLADIETSKKRLQNHPRLLENTAELWDKKLFIDA